MSNNLIIQKIKIENFRSYKYFEQEFGMKPVVLITGPNGYGKTTLIDAIEWGLTGDIKRISNSYKKRNTTQSEKDRVENLKGQIKNRESTSDEKVRVEIFFECNDIEFSVWREQVADNLLEVTSLNYSEGLSEEYKKVIGDLGNENFYPYFVCDNNKAYDFLRTPRKDVLELFRDFLQNNDYVDDIITEIQAIETIAKNKQTDIQDKLTKVDELIGKYYKEISELKNEIITAAYPEMIFYEGENIKPVNLTDNQITDQIEKLLAVGCNESIRLINELLERTNVSKKKESIEKLIEEFDENRDSVLSVIKRKFYDSSILSKFVEERKNIENRISETLKLTDYTSIQKFVNEKQEELSEYANLSHDIIKLSDKETEKNNSDKNIQIMQDGNNIIAALSDLVKYREAFIQYRQEGNEFCPLCGSKEAFISFANKDDISITAEMYVKQTNDRILHLKELHKQILVDYDQILNKTKENINDIYKEKRAQIELISAEANNLNMKYSVFFAEYSKLGLQIDEQIKEHLITEKFFCDNIIKERLSFDEIKEYLTKLMMYYGISDIRENNLSDILSNLMIKQSDSLKYLGFDYASFQQKLNYLKRLLENQKYLNMTNEIKKLSTEKEKIASNLNLANGEKEELHRIQTEINKVRKEFEIKELEHVGPYIYKVFMKIIKHSNINGITVKRDNSQNGGMVLVDDNGLNLMNTLSQGQLGVLMLAYFFANAMRNKDRSCFKTFFIDDITASLDDLNILAFLDMIKYIICDNKKIMNQIFFSTCNSDVEKLFIHKLSSMNIDYINLKFDSYAKVI